jgi:hypothetical protein
MLRLIVRLRSQLHERNAHHSFQREWDRARRNAGSPSHLAEIDAIFGRHAG